jgi:hypothetical protein
VNVALAIAAGLIVAVAVAHSYLGERYILTRLFRANTIPRLFGSDGFTRRTLRFAWHLTSVAWIGAAVALWALERGSAGDGMRALSVTFLATALVTLIGSRGRHLAWPVFLLIGVAVWIGAASR